MRRGRRDDLDLWTTEGVRNEAGAKLRGVLATVVIVIVVDSGPGR